MLIQSLIKLKEILFIAIIAILIGLLTSISYKLIIGFILIIILVTIYFLRNKFPVIFLLIILLMLCFNEFIQAIVIKNNIISEGSIPSILIYYFPIIFTWILGILFLPFSIFSQKKYLKLRNIDLIAILFLLYILLLGIFSPKYYGFNVFFISFLRLTLFITAFFMGRWVIRFNFSKLDKVLIIITVVLFISGILDVLTNHKFVENFTMSESVNNESSSMFYKSGIPRMMSLFTSPLSLGFWCSLMFQLWYYKFLSCNEKKYILPFFLTSLMLILSITRASWISSIVGIIIISLFYYKKIKVYFTNYVLFIIFIIVIFGSLSLYGLSNINHLIFINDSTDGHILGLTEGFKDIIKGNTLLGNGIGTSPYFLAFDKNIIVKANYESWLIDSIFNVGVIYIIGYFIFGVICLSKIKSSVKPLLISWFLTITLEGIAMNHSWYQTIAILSFWTTTGYFISKSYSANNKEIG